MFFFVVWGFLLWSAATLIIRIAGSFLFNPGNSSSLLIAFLVAIPLIILTTYPVYSWRKVSAHKRVQSALSIALPGMVLDIFSMIFFPTVFPNLLLAHADRYFSAWLLWSYSLILISGLFPRAD